MKKLLKIEKYVGVINLETGLAIKGSNNDLNIGGLDSEVVKNPLTGEPYIPGSSLKGKIRCLLELSDGKSFRNEGKDPCGCGECMICKLFGAHRNPGAASAPTRVIFRDGRLTDEAKKVIDEMPLESGSYLEAKAENIIERNTGKAGSPRFVERVPAGLSFTFEMMLQVFEGDDEAEMKAKLENGIKLLESSYLGSSGSRGYGQVKIEGNWVS